MTWVKTDDAAPIHPKFFRAGHAIAGWWWGGLAYCNRNLTDGFIPSRDLPLVYPGTVPDTLLGIIEVLVREVLLHPITKGHPITCRSRHCRRFKPTADGYLMHDYLDYQPSRKQTLATRQIIATARSEAGRQGGVKSGETRRRKAEANAKQVASVLLEAKRSPVPSRPVPSEEALELTTLSGSRPTAHTGNGYRQEAKAVLDWLNRKADKHFEFIDSNLKPIEARLREGREGWQLRRVVTVKCRAWATDEKMREYLRPATLFNKTKCAQYIGELPPPTADEETS